VTEQVETADQSTPRSTIDTLFGMDLRTLALVRILLGAFLLIDLALRSRMIEVFYTDAGALPRAKMMLPPLFSIYGWSGDLAVQTCLFGFHALVIALFLVGWRTRVVTIVLFFLQASIMDRNPLIVDGQDVIPSQLLLWGMFLPMGARWSVDALRGRAGIEPGTFRILSVASAAMSMQFVVLYVTTGLVKAGPTWQDWSAVLYSVSNDEWVRSFGLILRGFPTFMMWMAPATLFLEIVVPFFVLIPRYTAWIRGGVIATFVFFQAGLWFSIELRLFPFMSTVMAFALIPTEFWSWAEARFDHAWLAARGTLTWTGEGSKRVRLMNGAVAALCVIGLLVATLEVGRTRSWPKVVASLLWVEAVGYSIGVNQAWNMYGPDPPTMAIRTELEGLTAKGRKFTLLESRSGPAWDAALSMHTNYKLRFFLEKVVWQKNKHAALRDDYLRWVCRRWNDGADEDARIVQVRGISVLTKMLADPPRPPRRVRGDYVRCAETQP